MQQGFIYGWDSENGRWVKVTADSQGRLIIDPANILEDTPSDGQTKKGITSNWAYDHENDKDVHHSRYTANEAVNDPHEYVTGIASFDSPSDWAAGFYTYRVYNDDSYPLRYGYIIHVGRGNGEDIVQIFISWADEINHIYIRSSADNENSFRDWFKIA